MKSDDTTACLTSAARVVLLVLVMGLFVGCKRDAPETMLRNKLELMQSAVVERRPGDFMEEVSAEFTGSQGIDRAALHNLLRAQVLGNSRIGVTKGPVQVDVHGDRATARFNALLTGRNGRLLPDSVQTYAITSGWRIEGDEWRLYYAEWEPAQ